MGHGAVPGHSGPAEAVISATPVPTASNAAAVTPCGTITSITEGVSTSTSLALMSDQFVMPGLAVRNTSIRWPVYATTAWLCSVITMSEPGAGVVPCGGSLLRLTLTPVPGQPGAPAQDARSRVPTAAPSK